MREGIIIKSPKEIAKIRAAGQVVAGALDLAEEMMIPGMTTAEIDSRIERFIRQAGGVPAFLGYRGYPASACISINDEVVHGIPSKGRRLEEGDIVGVDVGVKLNGHFGDSARTFPVGSIAPEAMRLLDVTRRSLEAAIRVTRAGNRVGDISSAVERLVVDAGFTVVRTLVGHGVGKALHEEPAVPNYGPAGEGPELSVGMVLAIEPMVNAGLADVKELRDGWTIVTADGSLSAHFEHTVAITDEGPDVLTLQLTGADGARGRSGE
jgi:methionyl aminopeptidase